MNTYSALWLLALLLLLSPFLASALLKLRDFPAAMAEVSALTGIKHGLAPLTAAVVLTQLGGSALLLFGGPYSWLGGVLLAGFTLAATWLAHGYWRLEGPARVEAFNAFCEHVALVGALMLAALMRWGEAA